MSARERKGIFVGAGAGLMLVVLLVLQSFIGSGLLSTRTVTSTFTAAPSTVPDTYGQVNGAYADHLLLLDSGNISALVGEYEGNATINWTGKAPGFAGSYSGSTSIRILLGNFRVHFVNFSIYNDTQTVGPKGSLWVVNSTFDLRGYSTMLGQTFAAIDAQDSYVHVGGEWMIANETWDLAVFEVEFPTTA
jgi:hypothetical protein